MRPTPYGEYSRPPKDVYQKLQEAKNREAADHQIKMQYEEQRIQRQSMLAQLERAQIESNRSTNPSTSISQQTRTNTSDKQTLARESQPTQQGPKDALPPAVAKALNPQTPNVPTQSNLQQVLQKAAEPKVTTLPPAVAKALNPQTPNVPTQSNLQQALQKAAEPKATTLPPSVAKALNPQTPNVPTQSNLQQALQKAAKPKATTLPPAVANALNPQTPNVPTLSNLQQALQKAAMPKATTLPPSVANALNQPIPSARSPQQVFKEMFLRPVPERPKAVSTPAVLVTAKKSFAKAPLDFKFDKKGNISKQDAKRFLDTIHCFNLKDLTNTPKNPLEVSVVVESTQSTDDPLLRASNPSTFSPDAHPIIASATMSPQSLADFGKERAFIATGCTAPVETVPKKNDQAKSQEEINREALEKYPCTTFSLKGISDGWSRREMGAIPATKAGAKFVKGAKMAPTILSIIGCSATGIAIPVSITVSSIALATKLYCDERDYASALCTATALLPPSSVVIQSMTGREGISKSLGKWGYIVIASNSKKISATYILGNSLVKIKEGESPDKLEVVDSLITLGGETFGLAG